MGVILSGSRGAWATCFVSMLVIGLTAAEWRRRVLGGALFAGLALIAVSWLCFSSRFAWDDVTGDARWSIWNATLVLIRENPWFGVGPKGFVPAFESAAAADCISGHHHSHTHNAFLGLAVQSGIPALVLFLGLIRSLARNLWMRAHIAPEGLRLGFATLAVLIVGGLTEDSVGLSTIRNFSLISLGVALGWNNPSSTIHVEDKTCGTN